ncbi:hypothetical protein G4B88_003135 [Cannabis sativa]|uniref:Uncharacterized protein n=1 Tax=Cannabis sativa TaxID=3483 RepID=A0A7J6F6T7_CANSA|nr:hypothetical protein G4B88_003135 [Cannabis sativa]
MQNQVKMIRINSFFLRQRSYHFRRNWSYISFSFPFKSSYVFSRPFETPKDGQIPFLFLGTHTRFVTTKRIMKRTVFSVYFPRFRCYCGLYAIDQIISDHIDIPSTQHRSSKGSRRPTRARKPGSFRKWIPIRRVHTKSAFLSQGSLSSPDGRGQSPITFGASLWSFSLAFPRPLELVDRPLSTSDASRFHLGFLTSSKGFFIGFVQAIAHKQLVELRNLLGVGAFLYASLPLSFKAKWNLLKKRMNGSFIAGLSC